MGMMKSVKFNNSNREMMGNKMMGNNPGFPDVTPAGSVTASDAPQHQKLGRLTAAGCSVLKTNHVQSGLKNTGAVY